MFTSLSGSAHSMSRRTLDRLLVAGPDQGRGRAQRGRRGARPGGQGRAEEQRRRQVEPGRRRPGVAAPRGCLGRGRCGPCPARVSWRHRDNRGFAQHPRNRNHNGPVRLHHEPRRQDRAAEAPHPQGHLPLLLPGRQDRRARPERLGQVHAAEDHGRRRQGIRGRSHAHAGPEHRLPAAGAPAQPRAHRARKHRGSHGRSVRRQGQARRGVRRLRRARRRLRRAGGRAGAAGSHHRHGRHRLRAPAGDRRRRAAPAALGRQDRRAVGRREAPRGPVPPAAVQARHAAARRAHQPPGRRMRRVAGGVPQALPRHRGGHHPRPLLPGQRRRVDSGTRPRRRHSVEGQLQHLAGAEGSPPGGGAEVRGRPHQGDEEGAGVGAPEPEGAPGQEQVAAGPLRGTVRLRIPEAQRDPGDLHSGGRAPGQRGDRVQERQQVLRRPPADRQPELQGAGGRHRRHHRPERRRQVDAVQADRPARKSRTAAK